MPLWPLLGRPFDPCCCPASPKYDALLFYVIRRSLFLCLRGQREDYRLPERGPELSLGVSRDGLEKPNTETTSRPPI